MKQCYQLPTQIVSRLYDDLDFGNMFLGSTGSPDARQKSFYDHKDMTVKSSSARIQLSTLKSDVVLQTLKKVAVYQRLEQQSNDQLIQQAKRSSQALRPSINQFPKQNTATVNQIKFIPTHRRNRTALLEAVDKQIEFV